MKQRLMKQRLKKQHLKKRRQRKQRQRKRRIHDPVNNLRVYDTAQGLMSREKSYLYKEDLIPYRLKASKEARKLVFFTSLSSRLSHTLQYFIRLECLASITHNYGIRLVDLWYCRLDVAKEHPLPHLAFALYDSPCRANSIVVCINGNGNEDPLLHCVLCKCPIHHNDLAAMSECFLAG